MSASELIDLRCPEDPRTLLLRIRDGGATVSSENLLEISCDTCKKNLRQVDHSILRVIHCFDILGSLIESKVER